MRLRYGLNPQQQPAYAEPVIEGKSPLTVVNGAPSYVNLLDALSGWRLVREAASALGRPAAASFKHVSPAGAAVGDSVAEAYARARGADPKSSYGDFVAVSHEVDAALAEALRRKVSDGIVAPGYTPEALEVLRAKKRGGYLVLQADPAFQPPEQEVREVFGLRLVQPADFGPPDRALFDGLPAEAADDLLLGLIVLKYTQSNSVAYIHAGQAIGVGAGQQSRIDCTRIAGEKADEWWSRRGEAGHDVAFVSDGMFPFRDNVDEAAKHAVRWIAEPGGSIRTGEVKDACAEHGITHVETGLRLFQH